MTEFWHMFLPAQPSISLISYIFSHYIEYCQVQKSSRPLQDRSMVVATLAEVAQDMGSPIAGYVDVNLSGTLNP